MFTWWHQWSLSKSADSCARTWQDCSFNWLVKSYWKKSPRHFLVVSISITFRAKSHLHPLPHWQNPRWSPKMQHCLKLHKLQLIAWARKLVIQESVDRSTSICKLISWKQKSFLCVRLKWKDRFDGIWCGLNPLIMAPRLSWFWTETC